MKIDELNQTTAVSHLTNGRSDKTETADAHGESSSARKQAADKVEFSSYIPVVSASQKQEDTRVSRLEELKSQINDGSYQVSGRAVAEKMLSKIVMGTVH